MCGPPDGSAQPAPAEEAQGFCRGQGPGPHGRLETDAAPFVPLWHPHRAQSAGLMLSRLLFARALATRPLVTPSCPSFP